MRFFGVLGEQRPSITDCTDADATEMSPAESDDVEDVIAVRPPLTVISRKLDQLELIISLLSSNDELRQTVNDCLTKIKKLETGQSKTVNANMKLERTVEYLSTTVEHISRRIGDRPIVVPKERHSEQSKSASVSWNYRRPVSAT